MKIRQETGVKEGKTAYCGEVEALGWKSRGRQLSSGREKGPLCKELREVPTRRSPKNFLTPDGPAGLGSGRLSG